MIYREPRRKEVPPVNYMLIMQDGKAGLMAIGPMAIEYEAAMLRDELEEGSGWTALGIARVMNQTQARAATTAQAQ